MQRNGLTWGSWLQVAAGLLGLTWGLGRLRQGRRDWLTWTLTGLSAPVAVRGLTAWLPLPRTRLVRQALPLLTRVLS